MSGGVPWFVVTSNKLRQSMTKLVPTKIHRRRQPIIFLNAFGHDDGVCVHLSLDAIGGRCEARTKIRIERFAWVMAVFLFMQPTVNPWYWVWVAPLTCFFKRQILVAGGRFFCRFTTSVSGFKVFRATIQRVALDTSAFKFFDHGVAWLEFCGNLVGGNFLGRPISQRSER